MCTMSSKEKLWSKDCAVRLVFVLSCTSFCVGFYPLLKRHSGSTFEHTEKTRLSQIPRTLYMQQRRANCAFEISVNCVCSTIGGANLAGNFTSNWKPDRVPSDSPKMSKNNCFCWSPAPSQVGGVFQRIDCCTETVRQYPIPSSIPSKRMTSSHYVCA